MFTVLPTLLVAPNSFSLSLLLITTTAARCSSSCALQPLPYRNGTSSIGKNSL